MWPFVVPGNSPQHDATDRMRAPQRTRGQSELNSNHTYGNNGRGECHSTCAAESAEPPGLWWSLVAARYLLGVGRPLKRKVIDRSWYAELLHNFNGLRQLRSGKSSTIGTRVAAEDKPVHRPTTNLPTALGEMYRSTAKGRLKVSSPSTHGTSTLLNSSENLVTSF